MQVRSEWLQVDVEIHGRAETRVAVATLVRSAHPLPYEDETRSVEGLRCEKRPPASTDS